MRKLFLLFIALLATTALWAYDFKSGDLYYKITNSSEPYTVEVVNPNKSIDGMLPECGYPNLTNLVIPEIVSHEEITYTVTSIGEYAFCQSNLQSVIIPNTVTTIKSMAFLECVSLISVTLPDKVSEIGGWVFENAPFLYNHPNWQDGVLYIDNYLIKVDMSVAGDFIIKENTQVIAGAAFQDCSLITSVRIPKNIKNINEFTFGWCTSLHSMIVESPIPPLMLTSVGDIFYGVNIDAITLYVPCDAVEAYKSSSWNMFSNIQEPLSGYTLDVYSQHEEKGMAIVDKNSVCGAQISATANYGYHFTQWSDGVTDNPRTFVITQDTTFTAEFAPNQYTITTASADEEMGYTEGDTVANYLEYITLSAIANYGYHFVEWSDYTSENPRVVQVTEDMTYTAIFEKNLYYISLQSNNGTIESVTQAAYLDNVTMMAVADYGYHFTQWSDGVTDNPRTFVITQDTTFTAEFAQTYSGKCGDNLYWGYANDTLTITGTGAMYDERPWGLFVNEIQKIALPTGITHIGKDAFQDCIGLRDIDLPYTLETIGDYSFNGCRRLITINCYPLLPPIAESTSFSNYSANLYAPCDNLEEYKYDMVFGQFKYFECIGSESVTTDGTVITPGSTDVTITWPTDENADTYTILIMKGEEIFCRLLFNKDGQLLNIAFAPGRKGQNRALYAAQTANGLRFTVTGLEEQTQYGYDVSAKDEEDNTISSYTGEFTTQSNTSTSVSDIQYSTSDTRKELRNGQLIIIRDGVEYNAVGQEM